MAPIPFARLHFAAPNFPGGISDNYRARGYILRHHRPCTNRRTPPDSHTGQDDDTSTDEYVVFNYDRGSHGFVVPKGFKIIRNRVVTRYEVAHWPHRYVLTDGHGPTQHRPLANATVRSHYNIPRKPRTTINVRTR